ncbi:MAG TPA: TIGR03620 family F420-dependent LLM class oxidoreductase [Verrucomicrobiae bacterium]|nr:TIGR03620 family F420-dependent LLM class oxidoreductase [Verrucomicrobiae bacterium]
MIDVGPTHSALILWTPARLVGREIEVSPLAAPERRQHVRVLPRQLPSGVVHLAVYPSLPAGPHLIRDPSSGRSRPVQVEAARVTELSWEPDRRRRSGSDGTIAGMPGPTRLRPPPRPPDGRELADRVGPLGVFLGQLALVDASTLRAGVRAIEELGFGAIWCGEASGREALTQAAIVLAATQRIVVATGIANIWARDPVAMANGARALAEAWPGRFVLGLGASHARLVEPRGHRYQPPLAAMRRYLPQLAAAAYTAPLPEPACATVLAALGPRMLHLAGRASAGAHTFFVPVAHTRWARQILGPVPLLAPEQACVVAGDRAGARTVADRHVRTYLALPAYRRNLERLGWTAADCEGSGSDALFDALIGWGDPAAVAGRVRLQQAAGADHVVVQLLTPGPQAPLLAQLGPLAGALLGRS